MSGLVSARPELAVVLPLANEEANVGALLERILRHLRAGDRIYCVLDRVSRDGLFAWYSGNTEGNGRGSLMVYVNTPRAQSYFYVSLVRERDGSWKRAFIRDLTLKEVLAFERAGTAAA